MPNSQNNPTRIAFCITELDPGGAERALVQIITRLDRAKWTPIVYCLGGEGDMAIPLREHGVVVKCFGAKGGKIFGHGGALYAIQWLRNELVEYQPKLLQCFLFHANIVGRLAGSKANIPVILSGHRVAEKDKNWHLWVDWLTKSDVDFHVAVSHGVANFITNRLRLRKSQCRVIPNGVEQNLKSAEPIGDEELIALNVPSNAQIVIAAGRLHRQKGFEDLLTAFALLTDNRLQEKLSNVHLLIVGEGPQREKLQDKIKALGLSSNVTLTGYRSDVHALMRRADLFVLSSHWEGMSNVVMEAMAMGLPVVATNVEGNHELLHLNDCGIVVPPKSAPELMKAIKTMLADHKLSREMAAKAQQVVSERYTWDVTAQEYSDLFEELLTKKPK